ncbi:MAG TPA: hypothetical protein VMW53_07570 [archaeon]|nr:hypothetical protein [archaeon]
MPGRKAFEHPMDASDRLKSRRPGLLPNEENRKCGIVRCCAEFLTIGLFISV